MYHHPLQQICHPMQNVDDRGDCMVRGYIGSVLSAQLFSKPNTAPLNKGY